MAKTSQAPNYSEAYPRLDVLQASAAERRGQSTCVFTDESGRILGGVRYFRVNDGVAVLQTAVHGPYLRHTGVSRIELVGGSNQPEGFGRFAKCPSCWRRVQVLSCTDSWACAECHRLKYRRQLVDRKVLDAEELVAAEGRLKEPRPKGTHQETFAKLRARDEETVKRLRPLFEGTYLPVASDAHQFKVESRWFSEAEIRADATLSFALGDLFDQR